MDEATVITATTDDDIRQLKETIGGALGVAGNGPPSIDPAWRGRWAALATIGVAGFCVPEERGGSGLQVAAAAAAASEFGAALHGSPYAGLSACTHAIAGASGSEVDSVLTAVLEGRHICALGRLDQNGRVARLVDGAPEADSLLLVRPGTADHVLLTDPSSWVVDAAPDHFDVSRRSADVTVDISNGLRIPYSDVTSNLYGLLLGADAVGGVERMLTRTVAYAKERLAFGRPIGGFQAVQHRLVDHAIRARGMRLLVNEAAHLLASTSPQADRAVAVAELSVSTGAGIILHDLLQLTGAIGFTWEYGLHLYERRAHQDARLASNPHAAMRRLTQIEGWARAR